MKDLKTLLSTLDINGSIEFNMRKHDYELTDYAKVYKITKYEDKLDGGLALSLIGCHYTESYNTRSITRGCLNLYTFDIFNEMITTKIKIEDMILLSFKVGGIALNTAE